MGLAVGRWRLRQQVSQLFVGGIDTLAQPGLGLVQLGVGGVDECRHSAWTGGTDQE